MRFLTLTTLVTLGLISCVTPSANESVETRPTQPKYAPPASPPPLQVVPSTPEVAEHATDADLLRFITVHTNDANAPLSEQDHILLQGIEDLPPPASAAEAVVIIGTSKSLTAPQPAAAKNFEEEDLENQTAPTNNAASGGRILPDAAVPSLHNLLTTRGINLAVAIGNNPFLKNVTSFEIMNRALDTSKNPPEFVAAAKSAMQVHATQWQQFNNGQVPATELTPGTPTTAPAQVAALSPADLRSADNILMEAQKLATNKLFPEAINKAMQIPADSPMHSLAEDKIKAFSNQAVQELRLKAAQAFQSALPVSDPKTRTAYLQQARTFLEQAISNFPKADQIETVRENLAVITRDLEQIDDTSNE